MIDERTGEIKFYKREVEPETMILAPSKSPEWVQDRERLWNEVEKSETRKNSQVAREINIALPRELSNDQQTELIKNYVQAEFVDKGMVADISIHRDDKENPTNARDAVHVIDGLLHHESELNIEEHYTDTAGYTDQVFGLSHLLGFRFAPRLRDLSDTRLYVIDKPGEFPTIEKLLRGRINTKVILENYDDVLRLAHSIREGKVSGSLIMGKLGSYSRQNRLATALREMGRIEKTIFILDYISNEAIRRRIQRGLNKGEAMNALARALFFGKRGELRERALQDQLQRASALNILINAISVWNTVYLTEATKVMSEKGILQDQMIKHISPLGWEHINFLGEYNFDIKRMTGLNSLRPLDL